MPSTFDPSLGIVSGMGEIAPVRCRVSKGFAGRLTPLRYKVDGIGLAPLRYKVDGIGLVP